MSTVRLSENQNVSGSVKLWLALFTTVAFAAAALAGLRASVVNHEERLRAAEIKLEDVKEIKNDVKWLIKITEEERAERASKSR